MSVDLSIPILVVDDEWMMIEVMSAILAKLGFSEIDYAANGADALTKIREKPYGLVISDLNMRPMGGLQLLRMVRTNEVLKHTPFIVTTSALTPEHIVAAKHTGADGFLLKPFRPHQLIERITTIPDLARRQALV